MLEGFVKIPPGRAGIRTRKALVSEHLYYRFQNYIWNIYLHLLHTVASFGKQVIKLFHIGALGGSTLMFINGREPKAYVSCSFSSGALRHFMDMFYVR